MDKKIVALCSAAAGLAAGVIGARKIGRGKKQGSTKAAKFRCYYDMLNQWLALKQERRSLEEYFLKHGYGTIAVYGMGEMGIRLASELEGTRVKAAYGIDREPGNAYTALPVYKPEGLPEEPDAIVVSAVFDYDHIREELEQKVDCPVISLSDIVYELGNSLE